MTGPWTHRRLEHARAELTAAPAWKNYQRVRDAVLRMNELGERGADASPSKYWREELTNFEYMLDASPMVIDRLRQHTHHVTGLRVYDYRTNRTVARERFVEKLQALRKRGGEEPIVPESRALGGFGFDVDGELFNIDTLKFYEALVALRDGAVLDDLRQASERRLVWEIGGGWGGMAYQFKTACPGATYVISDFPELFLFSATYLMTLFPEASVRFFGGSEPAALFEGWEDVDFVFVPNYWLTELQPPRVDLAINMVSFQEMTEAQVDGYVRRAFDMETPFLYSLNRERSAYNTEIESVSEIIARHYWPHDISVMPMGYQRMLDAPPSENDYRHVIGWRRSPSE